MPERIFKYPLEITDLQTIEMPEGSRVLSVANQDGVLCLWAVVDPEKETKGTLIAIVGMGNPMPSVLSERRNAFVGTVLMPPFVWHVFLVYTPC